MRPKKREYWKGLSDIGRFSLAEPSLEGSQRSWPRGLFEHGLLDRSDLRMAENEQNAYSDKHAEFHSAGKFGEGMAFKI